MSWRKVRNTLAVVSAVVTLGGWAAWVTVRPWWKRWGVDPDEGLTPLPGDELIPDATVSDTRGIDIDAPPETVWPWLVQMGYGRAGWYSYDAVDMRGQSARVLLPEFQSIAPGDIVPTHPTGGFEVRAVDTNRALVLSIDSDLIRSQAEAARGATEASPANLEATGAFMSVAQPSEFSASWAFILQSSPGGGTRLIERFRARFEGGEKPWMRLTMPMMGFGVFMMMRKQMLGIRSRVEAPAA